MVPVTHLSTRRPQLATEEKQSVLEEAIATVEVSRMDEHGHPYVNMCMVRDLWSTILDTSITLDQVSLCMMALKIARQVQNSNRDNIVDIAGYCLVLEMCADTEGGLDGL